jgi:hypothetical protein
MVEQARARNATGIQSGRIDLRHGSVESLPFEASEVTLAGGNSKSSFSEIRTLVAGAVDRETEWRARIRVLSERVKATNSGHLCCATNRMREEEQCIRVTYRGLRS